MAEVKLSRHELKIKHRLLKERTEKIKPQYEDTRKLLQQFYDSYIQLYEYFPIRRHLKLKRLIRMTVSEDNINDLRKKVQESSSVAHECHGSNEDKDEKETEEGESRPLVSGRKPFGKIKQALRKVEKFCGLDDDPIEDEDVMSEEMLLKNINRRQRQISFYHSEMDRSLQALETLQNKYVRSRSTYFPFRFFTFKKMVRELVAATNPDSKYEK